MKIRTFAAIDVGSYELGIKIFEFSGKDSIREIDHVTRRLDLGADTFAMGKISNEKMDELCRTLKDFAEIMRTYRVEDYKAYGTSAIRETENSTIVQDQIAQRTGIQVDILSNSEQSSRRRRPSWTLAEGAFRCPFLKMTSLYPRRTCGWECCGFRII